MSATLRFSERPDGATFSSSVGTTVITNAPMTNSDYALTASTYTLTVKNASGTTLWTQSSVALTDGHVYQIPRIISTDSGATAGVVSLVV